MYLIKVTASDALAHLLMVTAASDALVHGWANQVMHLPWSESKGRLKKQNPGYIANP